MKKLAFYDAKPYDKIWFDTYKKEFDIELRYIENKLTSETAHLAAGCDGVIAFVNDTVDQTVLDILFQNGIRMIASAALAITMLTLKLPLQNSHFPGAGIFTLCSSGICDGSAVLGQSEDAPGVSAYSGF